MASKVESNGFLHEAVGEFFECSGHNIHIYLISCLFDPLHRALELLGEVEQWHDVDALFLRDWVNHSATEGRRERHCHCRCLLEARLEHIDSVILGFPGSSPSFEKPAILEEQVGRLKVIFNEVLQRHEVFSVLLCDLHYFLQVVIHVLNLALRLAIRVDMKLLRESLIELTAEMTLVKDWHH